MKHFEKIEFLLKSKNYDSLTREERALVDNELTQESYEEIRTSLNQLEGEKLKVRKDIKQSLMSEFREKESSVFSFLQFKTPAYTHLAWLLIVGCLVFIIPPKEKIVEKDRIVEITLRDTVKVRQVDTVWVEKVIKVPTPIYVTQVVEAEKAKEVQQVSNRSLSDQKEVLDLVVRGIE